MKTLAILLVAACVCWGQSVPGVSKVVIIVSENQSADHLCPAFPADFDCASVGHSKTLGVMPLVHDTDPPLADCGHAYGQAVTDIDHGAMDGFYANCKVINGVNRAYTQLYATDIPWLSALANNQIAGMPTVTLDRMFESEPDPSWGSHLFLIAATDAGVIGLPSNSLYWGCDAPPATTVLWKNPATGLNEKIFPCVNPPTIMDLANAAGVSLRVYGPLAGNSGYHWVSPAYVSNWRWGADWANVRNIDNFTADLIAGDQAQITILIPQMSQSGHPLNPMSKNQDWLRSLMEAISATPDWPNTAVVLIWDDWGGFYDHVAPPKQPGTNVYKGLRVAAMVVSPLLTHPGVTDHTVYDFGSVLKFAEDQFGLGCLTARDCNAASMNGEFQ